MSAVSAYDKTLEAVENLDAAQAKFDDILNSPSVDVACEKIKSLAKAKELDSSLILLINSAWASAKDSTTMKNEVLLLCCISVSFLSYCIFKKIKIFTSQVYDDFNSKYFYFLFKISVSSIIHKGLIEF